MDKYTQACTDVCTFCVVELSEFPVPCWWWCTVLWISVNLCISRYLSVISVVLCNYVELCTALCLFADEGKKESNSFFCRLTVTGLTKLLFAGNRFIRRRPHRVWTSHWSCALVFSLSAGHSVWIAYSLACWPGTIPPWTKTIPGQQCG